MRFSKPLTRFYLLQGALVLYLFVSLARRLNALLRSELRQEWCFTPLGAQHMQNYSERFLLCQVSWLVTDLCLTGGGLFVFELNKKR